MKFSIVQIEHNIESDLNYLNIYAIYNGERLVSSFKIFYSETSIYLSEILYWDKNIDKSLTIAEIMKFIEQITIEKNYENICIKVKDKDLILQNILSSKGYDFDKEDEYKDFIAFKKTNERIK